MEQNPSGGSVQQQHSPSYEPSAGDQVNRITGDSMSESQNSQADSASVANHSPGPLNSPQEMPSSTMDDRRGRARSLAVEEAKGKVSLFSNTLIPW